ncbi:MAG: hypothetical protein KGH93_03550, partial [Patescibacteria group bacterium]|nr:hypothetical protein [Patescibacteria group bacterium]
GLDQVNAYTGFSAQNVQANIPQAVATDSRGYLTLDERPILAAVVNAVKGIGSFIVSIGDGLAHLTGIAIGTKDKPEGITLYDTSTGEAYCLVIQGGNLLHNPGECGGQSTSSSLTTAVSSIVSSASSSPTTASSTGATSTASAVATSTSNTASSTVDAANASSTPTAVVSASSSSSTATSVPADSATTTASSTSDSLGASASSSATSSNAAGN